MYILQENTNVHMEGSQNQPLYSKHADIGVWRVTSSQKGN